MLQFREAVLKAEIGPDSSKGSTVCALVLDKMLYDMSNSRELE